MVSSKTTVKPDLEVSHHTSVRDICLSTTCSAAAIRMSLFQFVVFVPVYTSTSVPAHMPTQEESGLGAIEYKSSLEKVANMPTQLTKREDDIEVCTHITVQKTRLRLGSML